MGSYPYDGRYFYATCFDTFVLNESISSIRCKCKRTQIYAVYKDNFDFNTSRSHPFLNEIGPIHVNFIYDEQVGDGVFV